MNRRPVATYITTFALIGSAGCGGRSAIEAEPPPPEKCVTDKDCSGSGDACYPVVCRDEICVELPPLDCDDHDECTTDDCDPDLKCLHTPVTLDLDGDGHRAPLSGKDPGAPGSCGDDCDDTSAAAHPGGVETCDGTDNDCNGVIDDDQTFTPSGSDHRLSEAGILASPGGLASDGTAYLATYDSGQQPVAYAEPLDVNGKPIGPQQRITRVNAFAPSGPLVWTGDRYGTAWADPHDSSYEIYFNRLSQAGAKIGPDVRVTRADGFSVGPSLVWTGNEFVIAWQEQRDLPDAPGFHAFGQRIDLDGNLVGENTPLTVDLKDADDYDPTIAVGRHTLGLVFRRGTLDSDKPKRLMFSIFDMQLKLVVGPLDLDAPEGANPALIWNGDAYVAAWYDASGSAFIGATARAEDGSQLLAPTKVVNGPGHSRYPRLIGLGNRMLLVWSDDRDGNAGYELYVNAFDNAFRPLAPPRRVTNARGDSIGGAGAFGPGGSLGLLFEDQREGLAAVYFTQLGCSAGH